MRYLFIDTSNNLIISILENNKEIYCFNSHERNQTSAQVMPVLDEAFTKIDNI